MRKKIYYLRAQLKIAFFFVKMPFKTGRAEDGIENWKYLSIFWNSWNSSIFKERSFPLQSTDIEQKKTSLTTSEK